MTPFSSGIVLGFLVNRWLDVSSQQTQHPYTTTYRTNNVGDKNIQHLSLLKELSSGIGWTRVAFTFGFAVIAKQSITTLGRVFPVAFLTSFIGYSILVVPGFLTGNKLYHQKPPQLLFKFFESPLAKSLNWAKCFFVNDTSHLFERTELVLKQAKSQVNTSFTTENKGI